MFVVIRLRQNVGQDRTIGSPDILDPLLPQATYDAGGTKTLVRQSNWWPNGSSPQIYDETSSYVPIENTLQKKMCICKGSVVVTFCT